MNEQSTAVIQRDNGPSVFSEILSRCEQTCTGFLAVVFFDQEGETIDYHSYLDPFETKLLAAHCGVIMAQAASRTLWLNLGELRTLVFYSDKVESLILTLGEGFGVTLITESGCLDGVSQDDFEAVMASLRAEAGIV